MNSVSTNLIKLRKSFQKLINYIGEITIGGKKLFPYGWRKAAKGRTVWRILEEIVVQNMEKYPEQFDIDKVEPADSEVGVYDLKIYYKDAILFVNIKSSVKGGRKNKDDISKAEKLIEFFDEDIDRQLFIATFSIIFTDNMTIKLEDVKVLPIMWIPDIYVNPSNNGNLQSSKYKDVESSIERSNADFLSLLIAEKSIAEKKKERKKKKNY